LTLAGGYDTLRAPPACLSPLPLPAAGRPGSLSGTAAKRDLRWLGQATPAVRHLNSSRLWTERLKRTGIANLITIGACSLLGSCGSKAGDEFVGSWKAASDVDSTVITRRGDDFVVTNTGDPSARMALRYEPGHLVTTGLTDSLEIRYDLGRDAITARVPGFPVVLVLPRGK
jgi:hypothetical protein